MPYNYVFNIFLLFKYTLCLKVAPQIFTCVVNGIIWLEILIHFIYCVSTVTRHSNSLQFCSCSILGLVQVLKHGYKLIK